MNIYVGNLSYNSNEDTVFQHFANFGQVERVNIITDRFSGRSRGFAFVTMPNDNEANSAIEELNGSDLDGRQLVVNQARERQQRGY